MKSRDRCWSLFFPSLFSLPALFAVLAILAPSERSAWALDGPENVLLVINSQSPDSLCIANHYAALRHIPPNNFLYLNWDPKAENTDIDTFREKILKPVLMAAMSPNHGQPIPGRQIDYVIYSSGFPWGIQIGKDLERFKAKLEIQERERKEAKPVTKSPLWTTFTPIASINGLTFLWQQVLGDGFYIRPQANWYARTGLPQQAKEPTLAFSSSLAFGPQGEIGTGPGQHYLLSMVLGVTTGRGNTREEVLNYLGRSAKADGTHPRGTIYFVQNDDVRTRVRRGGFADAVKKLNAVGVAAEILHGDVPEKKKDVQGAMMGVADFVWNAAQSTILPGAICEHFTSFGGDLKANASQTPLSVWLRGGAAASSGTVTEPYAVPYKFPLPMMQVHYARGCTVAEAYYQAVFSPYQLLIVGDPLCRPWANIPEITVKGLTAGETVHDAMKLKPSAHFADGVKADHFEMILDGLKYSNAGGFVECGPDGTLSIDTTNVADGAHELRVVAESKGPVPARGENIIPFATANHGRTIQVTCTPKNRIVPLAESLVITVKSPQSTSIHILRGTYLLGTIAGDDGQVNIPANRLGSGPVRLQVVGVGESGPRTSVFAPPLDIVVE